MKVDDDGQWREKLKRELPLKVVRHEQFTVGPIFERHWHSEFQMVWCEKGEGMIHCNSSEFEIKAGSVVVINGNELHFGENHCRHLIYHVIKMDLSFLLSSQMDFCQIRYMTPLLNNQICFKNWIAKDDELRAEIKRLLAEFNAEQVGYELAVKACCYRILVCLLRRHQDEASPAKRQRQERRLEQMKRVFEHIECEYANKITLPQLAALANMSGPHFCRQFKSLTGKAPVEYVNHLRISRAVQLLQQGSMNISEVAMAVGFDDINYFSRLFKKYKQLPPSSLRK